MTSIAISPDKPQPLPSLSPPSPWLLMAECRAIPELGAYFAAQPILQRIAPGDGHPVLVLPGMGGDDGSTWPLRTFLQRLGYATYPWCQGRNIANFAIEDALASRLRELREQHGRSISLVGWSLGGVYARELAKREPRSVRQVITLGTPFTGHPFAGNGLLLYRFLTGKKPSLDPRWYSLKHPPPVPTTSIYSRTDGMVNWRCSLNEPGRHVENIEVRTSHCGMGHHPLALYVVADRLAQPEGQWRRFRPKGLLRLLFPKPGKPLGEK